MGVAPRAWSARGGLAVFITVFVAALVGLMPATPAEADTFLQAQTTATAVHVTVTQEPASSIITASLLDDAVAYAASDFDTGGSSEALAASAFPGRLVVQGPDLLCSEVFTCPTQPPTYPLLADASYPRRMHDTAAGGGQAMGSGPFVVTPVNAVANASAAANAGHTSAGELSLLAGTPGAVTVRTSSATSSIRGAGSRLWVHVDSLLGDVTVGGVVHIAAIRVVDDVLVRAGHRPVDHPTVDVIGVTAAGQPASIDDKGVHIAGHNGPSASRRLAQAGVTIRTVGAHRHDTKTGARSDAAALQVDVSLPVSGLPYVPNPLPPLPPPFDQVPQLPGVDGNGVYVAHVSLGAVGVAAGIGREPAFGLGGSGLLGPPAAGAGQTAAAGQPLAGGALVNSLSTTPREAAPVVAPQQPAVLRGLEDLLSKAQIEALYAVLALGTLGLFLGWRGAVGLRRRPAILGRRR